MTDMKLIRRVLLGCIASTWVMAANAQAPVEWRFFTYFPTNDKPAQLNRAFAAITQVEAIQPKRTRRISFMSVITSLPGYRWFSQL
jgi:hypothetical protein